MSKTIFTNASVLDGENPSRPGTTVVVDGERITDVTDGGDVAGPDDTVIDLAGKTLMPGMIIAHFHTQFGPFLDFTQTDLYISTERPPGFLMLVAHQTAQNLLASGWTAFISGACAFSHDAQLKMAIEEGIVTGPRIMAASPHMDTTANDQDRAAWWRETKSTGVELFCDGPDEFRKAVRREVKRGTQVIKIFASGGPGIREKFDRRQLTHRELMTVVETAHDLGARVRAHCCWEEPMIECIEAGVDLIDHGSDMNPKIAEMMADRGTFWTPTLHFLKALLREVPGIMMADVLQDSLNQSCEMLSVANAAGVKIMPGDDYGAGPIPHVLGMYGQELGIFVEDAGISPLDTIRFATRHGAEFMGMAGQLGTVAPGALADLVVVDGDPSEDISLLADPAGKMPAIMKGGSFFKNELV